MELYFTESENISADQAQFDTFESRHIIKTMRKGSGDLIQFTDGQGYLYQGKITATRPVLQVDLSLKDRKFSPPPVPAALGIGFIRPARMDYLVEKATELGITDFYLFPTRFSNFRTDNKGRWDKICRQAMKQCNRVYLPKINIVDNFTALVSETTGISRKYIADQNTTRQFSDILSIKNDDTEKDIIFLIGPEGGFHEEEIEFCKQSDFLPISFGNYRLRTETAAITAASYINLLRN